jgi:hypothetical protein
VKNILAHGFSGLEVNVWFWLLGLGLSKVVTDEVVGVFCYFDGFPDDAGMVDPAIDYDFCSSEVDAVSCRVSAECLSTADRGFSSLVSLMCSKILVDMW